MSDKIPGSSIEDNTITTSQMASNTWAQVYAALATANSAYNTANNAVVAGINVTQNVVFSTGNLGLGISPNTKLHVEGTSTFGGPVIEKINVSASAPTSTLNFDVLTQPILYLTSYTTTNWLLNIRGSSSATIDGLLRTGQAVTITLMVTTGGNPYKPSSVQVDGITQVVKWANGEPVGNSNAIDLYTFTVIKTGNSTFTVFGSQQKYV